MPLDAGVQTEDLGQILLDVQLQLSLLTSKSRRQTGDLKEIELLTLSILDQRDTLIVGDIQRMLGILPAQMSRIIRSLESRPRPLINCRINPNDKRKINVSLTAAGSRAYQDSKTARIEQISELLTRLSEDEQDELLRSFDKLRDLLVNNI